MRKVSWSVALLLGLALCSTPALAQDAAEGTGASAPDALGTEDAPPPLPDLDEVMSQLDDLYRAESSHSVVTMSIQTEHWSRTLEIEGWTLGDENAVMIIRAPAREAGTATLRTEEGLWNYAPRADRLMRVPSGMLSESWMGSHFTNDDLMRDSAYDDDFDTVLDWVEEDGVRLLRAEMTPHPDAPIVWTAVDFFMVEGTWTPVRADYYDGDELVRTFTFSDVRLVAGREIPMTMDVIPHDHPGESTRVQYDELELDVDVRSDLFTQRGLRRAAQR